jgi:hypothetical protein
MKSNSKIVLLAVLIAITSCNPKNSEPKLSDLQEKYDSLEHEYNILVHKYDSLIILNPVKKNLIDESDKVLSKYNITINRAKTGYILQEDLFLPSITIELKNLSQNDLKERVIFKAIFINNTTSEQLSDKIEWFCTESSPFLGGLTSQFTLSSSIGFRGGRPNVSVRLYVNNEYINQYKIKDTEYFGRLN